MSRGCSGSILSKVATSSEFRPEDVRASKIKGNA